MLKRKLILKNSTSLKLKQPQLNSSKSFKKKYSNTTTNLKSDYSSSTIGVVQLKKELEDPNNEHLKDSITSIMKLNYDINEMTKSYNEIKSARIVEENQIKILPKQNSFNTSYEYSSYLKGLSNIVSTFLSTIKPMIIRKSKTTVNLKSTINPKTTPLRSGPSKDTNEKLELLYQTLGHDSYCSLLYLYEKYCEYGKTITNFHLDYSQYCLMLTNNNLYLPQLPKEKCEVIYNRVKQINKAISFDSFIDILNEMCKEVLPKEDKWLNRLKYFYSAYISKVPCLKKTMSAKELERFYFMLESDDINAVFAKLLPKLYNEYLNNIISDLRYGEVMDSVGLIAFTKKKKVIPVFMSGKEVIEILNFVKYKRKKLQPSNHFDFVVFCEVLCLIALYSYGKYIREEDKKCSNKENNNIATSKAEQIKIFMHFIVAKENRNE